ncbi:MAG: hypothetical protein IGR80_09675 [Synechococcales cyanobacterium K44_A2020_017]|nr:hypothetical protein [Synechococcales cyanobacterium K32_A2020_035]MBF2095012.1 hypothetical protein [Synechococcales cyanobacterium K44_A2020_017]
MATAIPPVEVVLDLSTLSATNTREWMGFARVGTCYVPKIIHEEMRFLHERAPDPDLERVAREFNRFYRDCQWHISDAIAHHPALRSSSGEALTKRNRIGLAVARCAYGLAEDNPTHLVVLVVSDRAMMQRIYSMKVPNLCAINGAMLLQWSQTGQRPIPIIQKIQEMRISSGTRARLAVNASSSSHSTYIQTSTRIQSNSSPRPRSPVIHAPVASTPSWLPDVISILTALAALGIAIAVGWYMLSHSASQQSSPQSRLWLAAQITSS